MNPDAWAVNLAAIGTGLGAMLASLDARRRAGQAADAAGGTAGPASDVTERLDKLERLAERTEQTQERIERQLDTHLQLHMWVAPASAPFPPPG